VKSISNKTTRC